MQKLNTQDHDIANIHSSYSKAFGTDIEGLSIDEAIKVAGFDYDIDQQPLTYTHKGEVLTDLSKTVMTHSKNGNVFEVMGSNYKPVHPHQALEFYRDLTENNGMKLKRAGTLNEGSKVFAIASFDEKPSEIMNDIVSKNVILSTACDGTQATRIGIYYERLVCLNGMTVPETKSFAKVSHASQFDATKVKIDLGLKENSFKLFDEIFEELTQTHISDDTAVMLLHGLVGKKEKLIDESTRTQNIMRDIFNYAKNSAGSHLATCDKTAWGLLNGVTYYVDHIAGNTVETRTNNALFGRGAKLKNDAMSILRDVAKAENERAQLQVVEQISACELLGIETQ